MSSSSRTFEGILCIIIGMVFFVGQDVLMKTLLGPYPVWMLIFCRAVVAILTLTPLIIWLGAPHRLLTPLWRWHLLRAFLLASGFAMFYAAFPFMGFAEVTTIFFAAPLITASLASLFLGERIGAHRMTALLVGFAGVLVAMNPTGAAFQWVAILPLFCATFYALAQVLMRRIGDAETSLTVGLYTIALSGLMMPAMGYLVNGVVELGAIAPHLRADWPAPEWAGLGPLALLGGVGMVGFILVSRAYQIASPTLVAPFDYSYLPMAALVGIMLWGETPNLTTLIGQGLIIASGVYIGYRELVVGGDRDEPPPTAEATFAPGNPAAPMTVMSDVESEVADTALPDAARTSPEADGGMAPTDPPPPAG